MQYLVQPTRTLYCLVKGHLGSSGAKYVGGQQVHLACIPVPIISIVNSNFDIIIRLSLHDCPGADASWFVAFEYRLR